MNCPQCGTENPQGARFCLNCAQKLLERCPQCGTALPAGAKFCLECGAKVSIPETVQLGGSEAMTQAIQRLIPREFSERLLATRGQVARERRMVTILFSDVRGSTAMAGELDPEDWMEIMEGAFDVLIEPVVRYEGTLARLMGDAVLAFFGAPLAHEDDPERAIHAALAILEGAGAYAARLERERGIHGFGVRAGIHTGLVVVGEVGSDLRVEYTAMGDAVNLASRLEQAASPGSILISHDTYRHVRGVFDVLPQAPLPVKGKAEPVQTYLVERAKARAFRKPMRGVEGIETRMVGREAELKHLQEAFHTAVEDGELQVVTISGEAGVGKSRLLYEFDIWSEALPETFWYFKGRASRETQNLPYGLLRDLVAFRFQIQDTDSPATVRQKLEEGVSVALGAEEGGPRQSHVAQQAHLIGYLVGFEVGDSPRLAGVRDDPQRLRDQALAQLVGYFRAMAAQFPVLILLEDLQWADDSSMDALNHLALALAQEPVMIVSAARPGLFERRPHWGEGQPFHRRLVLEPLSRWDSRRLVAEILRRVDQVPEALRDLVVTGAEGNPFFIEELIKMLVEDGVIVKGADQWHLEPARLREVRVPPTLTGVLQARLDRLPLEERTVLQQASVVGRLFWDRAVARIHQSAGEGDEVEVLDRLSALRDREMVFQRETSAFAGTEEYLFKHNMLREVTYESVLKRVRRVYHGLVADWLLEQAGERVGEYTGLIADHLALAGRTAEAVEYLLEAGDRARGLYAHREAIGAYERALALLKEAGDEERAARTLMKLGLVHDTAFDFPAARQAYEEGFALWQSAAQRQPAAALPPAPHGLRLGWADVLTLDPGLCIDTASSTVIRHLFSRLLDPTPELGIVPDVAARWQVLDGGRRYVFYLRDDVRWSDGWAVTAHDFEYAWKRLLDPATASLAASLAFDIRGARAFHEGLVADSETVGVRACDDWRLEVSLEAPCGYFLQLLSSEFAGPVPRHVVEQWGPHWTEPGHIVTNGPFTLEAWTPGESLALKRSPHYHGRFGGNVERVELVVGWRGEVEPYEAGLVDLHPLDASAPKESDRARRLHAEEYLSLPEATTEYVAFDVRRAPFDDPRVRRAFALAVDRETLAGVTLGGYYSPASGGLVPPGMPGHVPGVALPYDPARARDLLAEAGYAGGSGFPPVDFLTPQGRRLPVGKHLRDQWRENLGVEVRWSEMPWAEYIEVVHRDPPHLFGMSWAPEYPDPDNFLGVAVQLHTAWRPRHYLELMERARRSTDQVERMRLYAQVERLLAEEVPLLPLSYARLHVLLKPWVRRYPISVCGDVFWKDVILEPH
jgi:ABC-type oligopeptide transport system substrate-binding subunit/class 3 adenylate cyclase